MMAAAAAYGGLALAAFLAATLLPAQSEALLAGLVIGSGYPAWALVLAAGLGNVAGALVNYALGRGLERLRGKPWFPVPEAALARAQRWYARGGRWVLLLAWVPVVGDPLTAMAGVMREKLWVFIPLVAIGKFARYAAVAWAAAQY